MWSSGQGIHPRTTVCSPMRAANDWLQIWPRHIAGEMIGTKSRGLCWHRTHQREHVSMKITLTSSYHLTDELGKEPRVVNRRTGDNYGPDDIVAWHPTGDLQRCRHLVRRAAAGLKLTEEQRVMVSQFIGPGRPLSDNLPAIDSIHLRVTTERKSTYVHAAQARKLKLSEWMQNACDRAVGR